MAKFRHHIFICTNRREPGYPRGSCSDQGEQVRARFKEEVARRRLAKTVRVNGAGCLDGCEHGPAVVVYPEATWYGRVRPEDVPEIVESHIAGGRPVERLLLPDSCINEPCEHRRKKPGVPPAKEVP